MVVGFAVTLVPLVALRPWEGDQAYMLAPVAVRTTKPPEQIVGAAGVIVTVGCASSFRMVMVPCGAGMVTPVAVTPLKVTEKVSASSHFESPLITKERGVEGVSEPGRKVNIPEAFT